MLQPHFAVPRWGCRAAHVRVRLPGADAGADVAGASTTSIAQAAPSSLEPRSRPAWSTPPTGTAAPALRPPLRHQTLTEGRIGSNETDMVVSDHVSVDNSPESRTAVIASRLDGTQGQAACATGGEDAVEVARHGARDPRPDVCVRVAPAGNGNTEGASGGVPVAGVNAQSNKGGGHVTDTGVMAAVCAAAGCRCRARW